MIAFEGCNEKITRFEPVKAHPVIAETRRPLSKAGGCLALIAFALRMAVPVLGADLSAGWRIYKASDKMADTFASSVTLSARTNVWVRHGSENDRISRLDGYSVRTMPAPGEGTHPIYESRSGQLWSVYPEGLMLFQGEQWTTHPIAEIRAVVQAEPLRRIRSIPLAPAELDHVLFLLPDRLLEYSADTRQVSTLVRLASTSLGRFNDMIEAADGTLWITGLRGAGRIEGPIRQIRSGARWKEWLAPDTILQQILRNATAARAVPGVPRPTLRM